MTIKERYVFVEKVDVDYAAIRLMEEKYGNLIYHYKAIRIVPIEKDDLARVTFEYNILENPGNLKDDIFEGVEFINLLGDIVVDILVTSFEEKAKNVLEGPDKKKVE